MLYRDIPVVIFAFITIIAVCYSSDAESKKIWSINPGITVSESYSENIAPNSDEFDESDFITQINPTLKATISGHRIQGNLDWRMENINYSSNNKNSTFNTYLANGTIEALSEHFFIDLSSTLTQRIINTNGVRTSKNYTITSNRTDQITSSIRPYWYQAVSPYTEALIDIEYGGISLDNDKGSDAISDSKLASASLLFRNRLTNQRLLWKAHAYNQRIQYDDNSSFDDLKFAQAGIQAGYQISPGFSPLVVIGYEKNDYGDREITEDPEDIFWALGFRWQANPRSSLETLAGRRFFGNSYKINWHQRARHFTSDLTYRESIEGESSATLRGISYIDNPDNYTSIALGLTGDVFVSKTARALIQFKKSKTSVTLTPFSERRVFTNSSQNESIRGLSGTFDWAFAKRTSFNLNMHWDKTKTRLDDSQQTFFFTSAKLLYQLGKQSTASLEYTFTESDSRNDQVSYSENAITAEIRHWFGTPPSLDTKSPRKLRSKQREPIF